MVPISGDQGVGAPPRSMHIYIGALGPEFKLIRAFLLYDSYEPGSQYNFTLRSQHKRRSPLPHKRSVLIRALTIRRVVHRKPSVVGDALANTTTVGSLASSWPLKPSIDLARPLQFGSSLYDEHANPKAQRELATLSLSLSLPRSLAHPEA